MGFIRTLDTILTLPIGVRKNLDHFIDTARYIPTDSRLDKNHVPDFELGGIDSRIDCSP
jgi:hypothetical protein